MVKPEGEEAEMKEGGGESGMGLLTRVKEKENAEGAPEGIVKVRVPVHPSNFDAFRKMGGVIWRISTWPEGDAKAVSPPIVIWESTICRGEDCQFCCCRTNKDDLEASGFELRELRI
jgi:hypothetical protein